MPAKLCQLRKGTYISLSFFNDPSKFSYYIDDGIKSFKTVSKKAK